MSRARGLVTAGVCVALGIAIAPSLAVAADKVQSVVVANPETTPVPVRQVGTPSVTLSGTPEVRLGGQPEITIAGTPEVRLGGNPEITIAGTPRVTLAEEPVQDSVRFVFQGSAFDESDDVYTVPQGKRLRIDTVTFHDSTRPSSVERFAVKIADVSHFVPTSTQAGGGDVAAESLTLHAKAGDTVRMLLTLDAPLGSSNSTFFMHASWSGVLLPA